MQAEEEYLINGVRVLFEKKAGRKTKCRVLLQDNEQVYTTEVRPSRLLAIAYYNTAVDDINKNPDKIDWIKQTQNRSVKCRYLNSSLKKGFR